MGHKLTIELDLSNAEIRELITGDDPEYPPFTHVAMNIASDVTQAACEGRFGKRLQGFAQGHVEMLNAQLAEMELRLMEYSQ